MIADLEPYAAHYFSRLAWLGQVPEQLGQRRMKFLLKACGLAMTKVFL